MLYLSRSVASLCDLVAKDTGRYALTGVMLKALPGGGYRAEATDGRRALVVQDATTTIDGYGNKLTAFTLAKLPEEPEIAQGLLPAAELRRAFKMLPSGASCLAAKLLEDEAILVAGNVVLRTPYVDGRFPDVGGVMPKGKPVYVVTVNPFLLAELLKSVGSLMKEDEMPSVDIAFFAKDGEVSPFGVVGRTSQGLFIDGLLMPLEKSRKEPAVPQVAWNGVTEAKPVDDIQDAEVIDDDVPDEDYVNDPDACPECGLPKDPTSGEGCCGNVAHCRV